MNLMNDAGGACCGFPVEIMPSEFAIDYWIDKSAEQAQQWASDQLFGIGVDSAGRAFALYNLLSQAWMPDSYKWKIFQNTWPSCDNVDSGLLSAFENCFSGESLGWEHLSGQDLVFYNSLPDEIEVFRGSSPARKSGWSWATDISVATSFARGHRGIAVPGATIYRGVMSKNNIWSVFTARGESEILSPPSSIDRLRGYRRLR